MVQLTTSNKCADGNNSNNRDKNIQSHHDTNANNFYNNNNTNIKSNNPNNSNSRNLNNENIPFKPQVRLLNDVFEGNLIVYEEVSI
jgi:hypothetical protein